MPDSNTITITGIKSDYGSRKKPFLIKYYINDTANSESFSVTEKIDNTVLSTITLESAQVQTVQINPRDYSEGNHTFIVTVTAPDQTTQTAQANFFTDLDKNAYLRRSQRNLRARINLLNFNFQTVDEISGDVVDGNIAIDANSDIRRTCDLTLAAVGSKYNIEPESRIWLNRYVQIYIGVADV